MIDSKIQGQIAYELDAKAENLPDFNIVVFENGKFQDKELTYQDIVINGRKIAKELGKAGIGKGDTFALLMRNHPEFIYSLYAGSAIGAVMMPIDPRIKGKRLKFILKDSRAKGIIFTSEHMDNVEDALSDFPDVKVIGVSHKDGMEVPVVDKYPVLNEILSRLEVPPPDKRNDDLNTPLEILYTSGTTGNPKGVILKGTRLAGFSQLAKTVWQYTSDDRLYTGLSLAHANAQAVTMIPSLLLSIPSVISRTFTKSRIWDICRQYGCTTFSLLGGMMMGIYSEANRPGDANNSVRLVLSAGTPRTIWEDFEKRFNVRIHEWYAALEGGFAHKPLGIGPLGSFGKPLEGMMEMKVVRENDTECEPLETGEIVSRLIGQKTEVVYLGKRDASQEKTRGGWLRSGDIGHVDDNGWFFFDYRKGGGLRRSGDFIQPEYVEAAIAEHPDVTDVCVYGIPASSGAPGESDIVAAFVPVDGYDIDLKTIFGMFIEKLERNAIPSYIQVVNEIPKSVSEKNLARLLSEDFRKDADNVYKFSDFNKKKEKKMSQNFEELKPIIRPSGVHRGVMKFDTDKCTSCGLCIDNCVFRCLEMDENNFPRMKQENVCFSCFNCMVACPVEAVSVGESYRVDGGFYDTEFPEITMPLDPEDAEGNPARWNEVEQLIFERRSVRNFKDKPVPDTLIHRILEAGRFAPSGGNMQPWKFTVITDKTLINEAEESCWAVWDNAHKMYTNDDTVVDLVKSFGEPVQAGIFDPRVMGGVACVSNKDLPIFLNAPALILMGGNDKMHGPDMHVGIAGQNMNLAALSLGLGFCWIGFSVAINFIPELKAKLGFDDPWRVLSAAVIGYPKFKQQGIVKRQNRPVTWFRSESK